MVSPRWQFWIDVGGTFTDCVGVSPDGQQQFAKVLSAGMAPITAIRKILNLNPAHRLPPMDVRLGTTRGTNALLTRSGAEVCFVTTQGFGDLLHIGFQNRPDIFAIDVKKPEQLFSRVVEVDERIQHDGSVERVLDEDRFREMISKVKQEGIESLAVCLMHAYRYHQHEKKVEEIARQVGFEEISLSHEVAPAIRIIPRAYTTVLDAYLNPILRRYTTEIQSQLHPDSKLLMFSSSGSLVPPEEFTGKDSILSGPAGGVVGFSKSAQQAGIDKSIGIDMGGTSTDVARFDGTFQYQYESRKSGVYIVAPTLAIETVAAGGGSICRFDGLRLQVGPQSAGAEPGPACYGRGGPLSLSDINLSLNRISEDSFPFPLDRQAVIQRLETVREQMVAAGLPSQNLQWIAEGFFQIAVAKTAEAIRLVSIQKGYDCSEYTLVAFGGAAGQICCPVAEELQIDRILVHPQGGILSAVGIGLADQTKHNSVGLYSPLEETEDLEAHFDELERPFFEPEKNGDASCYRRVDLRYEGTESWLTIPFQSRATLTREFEQAHLRRFGYLQERPLEIGSIRTEWRLKSSSRRNGVAPDSVPNISPSPQSSLEDGSGKMDSIDRASLNPGDSIDGPVMICDPLSTLVVDSGWTACCQDDFQLMLERNLESRALPESQTSEVDQVQVELLNNQFFSIAEQMGETLRATAVSVNVKERLDFSCAIFDGQGNLIANAPHIPIHLGAMSECVKCLMEDNPIVRPGDTFVTNDPYRGGSHLPDITVVTPCFGPGAQEKANPTPSFWVASRAHHAEMGGKVPGSMPPDSTHLEEEGVLIQNFQLIEGGKERFDQLREILTNHRYPSRQPDLNLSDIKAQLAANRLGLRSLEELLQTREPAVLQQLVAQIFELAAFESRKVIELLPRDRFQFEDYLDCGARIAIEIQRSKGRLTFDFSGTSPTLPNNLNANSAIVHSAIIYCIRLLVGKAIPLNQGLLDPIEIVLPECFLNPKPADSPAMSPAIVGGNVETSQRVVDVILGALEVAAASQGTSNNVIFGNDEFGYYETVCGGSGASANSDGADAIQCHITNTRITDPEILETRYPVILDEFSIRTNSGGSGRHHGGNGVVRKLRFREPLKLSVLSNRYGKYPPFGMCGGQPGKTGEKTVTHDGDLATGLTLKTPGGGGYGSSDPAFEE